MMRKYPIGMQSFRKIREEGYLYIDKTEIIHQLVESGNYYFLSRPRRFGKSLLLDTIEELFEGNKELFKGLWIENHWNWEKTNPVIHFNFSSLPYSEVGLEEAIKRELIRIGNHYKVSFASDNIKDGFRNLIKSVAEKYGKIVLLIDEYDKPIIDYLYDPATVDAHRSVMKNFYSVLKAQDDLIRFMLLTGVSRFSRVTLFSDLNHLSDITLIEEMNDLCGITQAELETVFKEDLQILANKFDVSATLIAEKVKAWYNGYSWGGQHTIYNPFSLLSLLRWKQFENYWIQTGTPGFFYDMIQRNPNLQFPLGEVNAGPETLVDLFDQKAEYGGPDSILPVTILFQTGYLTVKSYDTQRRQYTLDYPNLEVRESMQVFLLGAYTHQSTDVVRPTVWDISDAFQANNIDLVMKLIDTQFANIPNTLWIGAGERFYHAIIHNTFGLLDIMMESERNYAGIRPDLTVITKTHIYVLEFKLDGSAEEALSQIIDNDYFRPFQFDSRKKVAIGVNLSSQKKAITEYRLKMIS